MCDPPLNSSHEVWPSPFGAHFHRWPSPLRPQPSPAKKKRTFPKLRSPQFSCLERAEKPTETLASQAIELLAYFTEIFLAYKF